MSPLGLGKYPNFCVFTQPSSFALARPSDVRSRGTSEALPSFESFFQRIALSDKSADRRARAVMTTATNTIEFGSRMATRLPGPRKPNCIKAVTLPLSWCRPVTV
jgi:hypothetical protein